MRKRIEVLAVGIVVLKFTVGALASDLEWEDISGGNINPRTVLVNPDNSRIIYVGSNNAVIKSEDGGQNWRSILSVKGENRVVNFLISDPIDKNYLYAATGNGLFSSDNRGQNWRRIFRGKNSLENECTTLAVLPNAILLGTRQGLFISKDRGRLWNRLIGRIGKGHILAIAFNIKQPNNIYVASIDGAYKTVDYGTSWDRIFIAHPVESEKEKEEGTEVRDEEDRISDARYISCDPNNSNILYLATKKGVYKSSDKGLKWDLLTPYGLLDKDARFLLISPDSILYAVTKTGIFRFESARWYELSLGLAAQDIRYISLDKKGNLYAASDRGLFKVNINHIEGRREVNLKIVSKDEPKIREIQEAAIKYAEVEPEKIMQWRAKAAKKALLPKVCFGLDRNTSDLWHWEGGSTTKSEDDALRRGRDTLDWDVTLTWDLGELIWNLDQTSIDVRSKLMVELRNNIVDEVTKLYFERLRVKMELESLGKEDRKKRNEEELRLQELQATLDGFTGGYFSSKLNSILTLETSP